MTYLPISAWDENDRPRERFRKLGAANMSDAELLAILISTGRKGVSALDLARQLLKDASLAGIDRTAIDDLLHTNGVGPVKAIKIKAALELGKRLAGGKPDPQANFSRPSAVYNHFRFRMRDAREEYFYTLLLNQKNNLIREEMVTKGTLTSSVVHPREVMKGAIQASAAAFIAVHNHPSGAVEPSAEDLELTRRLREAATVVGIRMLDHVIVGYDTYASLFEQYPEFRAP
ncbi:MAG: DNA repair protein RadC [Planctomycetota bacterium]